MTPDKEKANGNMTAAWIIIGFIVLTAILTFVNQVITLLEKTGVIPK